MNKAKEFAKLPLIEKKMGGIKYGCGNPFEGALILSSCLTKQSLTL